MKGSRSEKKGVGLKAFYLSEEGVYAECINIGYLRICGETIEYRDEEEAISESLNALSRCLEENTCSKGIILSGNRGKIKRIAFDTYLRLVNEVLNENNSRTGINSVLIFSSKKSLNILRERPWLQGNLIEIVINTHGVFLGVKNGKLVIIPRLPHTESLSIVEKETFKEMINEISKLIPWSIMVSHALNKAYRRIQFALETPPPLSVKNCLDKGIKIECYKYRGSSRCIFDPKVTCPLRLIYRRPPSRDTASAVYWIMRMKRKLPPLPQSINNISDLDKTIAWFLLSYIEALVYETGLTIKEIMNIPLSRDEAENLAGTLYRMQVIVETVNEQSPKLGSYINLMRNEAINISRIDNPFQKKTYLIIATDSLPYKIRRLSKIVKNYRTYLACKPTYISPKTIEGYLKRFFPLLGGELSRKASEIISNAIGEWGCVEPGDLVEAMDIELAGDILELLTRKNLLKRLKGKDGYLYALR